jgi:hypothetical protein
MTYLWSQVQDNEIQLYINDWISFESIGLVEFKLYFNSWPIEIQDGGYIQI